MVKELRNKISKYGQSVIEYAFLFAIVTAAFLIMQHLANFAVQGRLKQVEDEISEPVVDEAGIPY